MSCVHKASGRVRKTAKKCAESVAPDVAASHLKSVAAAAALDAAAGCHRLALGTQFSAPPYDKVIHPDAKDWLLVEFKQSHLGGKVNCVNSRFDYIYAKCFSCKASAAVSLKQPVSDKKWCVTTVKNGADAACRSLLPPTLPPCLLPLPPCPTSPPQAEMTCLTCLETATSYVSCDSGHATCWTCMDGAIEFQCATNLNQEFILNRGITCPCCRPIPGIWRLPLERFKHKLSPASVQHVAKAERDLIIDDAYQAAIAANPKKDHVDSMLEWLFDPEKCPQCDTAILVCTQTLSLYCVHKRSHGDAAQLRMHSNVLHQVQSHILPVLPDNVCRHKSSQSLRRLPQPHLGLWQKASSQCNVHRFRFVSCK